MIPDFGFVLTEDQEEKVKHLLLAAEEVKKNTGKTHCLFCQLMIDPETHDVKAVGGVVDQEHALKIAEIVKRQHKNGERLIVIKPPTNKNNGNGGSDEQEKRREKRKAEN